MSSWESIQNHLFKVILVSLCMCEFMAYLYGAEISFFLCLLFFFLSVAPKWSMTSNSSLCTHYVMIWLNGFQSLSLSLSAVSMWKEFKLIQPKKNSINKNQCVKKQRDSWLRKWATKLIDIIVYMRVRVKRRTTNSLYWSGPSKWRRKGSRWYYNRKNTDFQEKNETPSLRWW